MSLSDSRFDTGSRRAGDTVAAFLRWHIDRRIEVIKETQHAHRSSGGRVWWYDGGTGDGVVHSEVKSNPRVQVRQDVAELGAISRTRCWYDVGGGGSATGTTTCLQVASFWWRFWRVSRFLQVLVWRCRASAKRSRLFPAVSEIYMNESVFALNFLETGGVVVLTRVKK